MENKPDYFREAKPRGKADKDRSAHGNQSCQVAGRLTEVRNTIQSRKIRQCSIEQFSGAKLRQMLCRQKLELDWRIRILGLHAPPSRLDHSFGCVACNYRNVMPSKKERVFPSTAIKFQDMSAGFKGLDQNFPYGSALGAAAP